VKAAAYWFDHRHDTTGDVANVDIGLLADGLALPLSADTDADDNKAYVFIEDAPNDRALKLRFTGINVLGHDDPLCGEDAIRVYYVIFAEDSDRNSPTYNSTTGIGVAPEDI
jgi:hypothetical protein